MAGRRNHAPTRDETLHEHRMREQIERGEKITGTLADWLDRRGPATHAGSSPGAAARHSHIRRT